MLGAALSGPGGGAPPLSCRREAAAALRVFGLTLVSHCAWPPAPGPDQAKLPLHAYLARAGYPAVRKKRGFWDASWQAWNINLTRQANQQAKRAEEGSRLEKRAARAAGAVGAPGETPMREAPASTGVYRHARADA